MHALHGLGLNTPHVHGQPASQPCLHIGWQVAEPCALPARAADNAESRALSGLPACQGEFLQIPFPALNQPQPAANAASPAATTSHDTAEAQVQDTHAGCKASAPAAENAGTAPKAAAPLTNGHAAGGASSATLPQCTTTWKKLQPQLQSSAVPPLRCLSM